MPQWLSFLGSAPRRLMSRPRLNLRWAAAGLMALVLGCGCGPSRSGASTADVAVKHDVMRGVEEIRSTHDREETPCPTRPHHHEPSWRARVNGGGGTGETDGPRRVRTDPEGSQESDRLHRQRQRGSRGGNAGCKAGRPVLEARRRSDSNGRAGARDSDRRARRVLSRPPNAPPRPPGDVAEVRSDRLSR